MPLNVVLVEPEIPQNTGNIARTCAVTGSTLHLIEPLGFSLEEKLIRRAGLDYWNELSVHIYNDMHHFYYVHPKADLWYFSSKVNGVYTHATYNENSFLVFGNETKGLREKLPKDKNRCVTIPMADGKRCLNLSNAVAIAVYEALRQTNFSALSNTLT